MKHAGRLRLLITAGPTREYIDSVRYLSNDSSGRMGFALAVAAARRGHRVTLVHGPVALPAPPGVRRISVVSAREMLAACREVWSRQDVLIKAAAVADYTPTRRASTKRKKDSASWSLELAPTTDILATLARERSAEQVAIGFALEDRAMRRNAERKLRGKGLDAIVLNAPSAIGAGRSDIEVFTPTDGWKCWPNRTKTQHAQQIIRLAERLSRARR